MLVNECRKLLLAASVITSRPVYILGINPDFVLLWTDKALVTSSWVSLTPQSEILLYYAQWGLSFGLPSCRCANTRLQVCISVRLVLDKTS